MAERSGLEPNHSGGAGAARSEGSINPDSKEKNAERSSNSVTKAEASC